MQVNLFRLFVVIACFFNFQSATAEDYPSRLALGDQFITALKQQRFDAAAAMFEVASQDKAQVTNISALLKRVGEYAGGFGNMENVLAPQPGPSRQLELAGQARRARDGTFMQIRYKAKANDGDTIFYVVNFTDNGQPAKIRSFVLEIPTPEADAVARADRLFNQVR